MTRKEITKSRAYQISNAALEHASSAKNVVEAFEAGAEWADATPSENHIAAYLGKKGWPLSSQGISTYEESTKIFFEYYEHNKKQWIDKATNWIALNAELYGGFNHGKLNEMVEKFKKSMEE